MWNEKSKTELYLNRELSWLSFEDRIHEEVTRTTLPLLERLRFLSIASSNLDEFFMVRVAGIRNQVQQSVQKVSIDGQTPMQQLQKIRMKTAQLYEQQQQMWFDLQAALNSENIHIVKPCDLSDDEQQWVTDWFTNEVFASLTPLAIDSLRPFPNVVNDGLVVVCDLINTADHSQMMALVPIPLGLNRFVHIHRADGDYFVAVEDIIVAHMDILFSGFTLNGHGIFHIVRDTGLEMKDEADDLVGGFTESLRQRAYGQVVRLFILEGMPPQVQKFITKKLKVQDIQVYTAKHLLDISDIGELTKIDRPDLVFAPANIRFPSLIREMENDYFAAIARSDFIVHHPYETFDVVVDFLAQAAADPQVVAIKQTLYRTSDDSPIVRALCEAAQQGKSVTAVIEIKARFNEEANLKLAKQLEQSGAQVIYGFVKTKIHAKLSMAIRQEKGGLKSYCHIGTGNYHPSNAKVYTDFSVFSCDPMVTRDVAKVFNFVTGYAMPKGLESLAVSPYGIQNMLLECIDGEIDNAKHGRPAHIWIKINNLVSPIIINKLYEASCAGVHIELLVRSICCLRPGVQGMSENITVRSVVGRFLEHSRMYCFGNGNSIPHKKNILYVSSADLMPRNLERRIEVAMPITAKSVRNQLLNQVIYAYKKDTEQSWFMQADGTYMRNLNAKNPFSAQYFFMTKESLSGTSGKKKKKQGKKHMHMPSPKEFLHDIDF